MRIDKIELTLDNNKTILIDGSNLGSFWAASNINPRRPIKTLLINRLNKLRLLRLLLSAAMNKIIGASPAVSENSILSILGFNTRFNKIKKVKILLGDKHLLFDTSRIHLLNLLGDLRGVILNNQYALSEKNMKDKIVIDAGSHNGEFSLFAVLMGAKKVYAFEPVSETAKMLAENIRSNKMQDKIVVIQKALGKSNALGDIVFNYTGDGAASIGQISGGKHSEKIEIVRLDDFVREKKINRVDFIKMDVEGFEENVLIGAGETIKRFKPILSLSAYHKPTDKKKLPMIIKSLRRDYHIVLNKFDEEDIYCD